MQRREAGHSIVGAGRLAAAGTLVSAALVASHCLAAIGVLIFGTTIGALSALNILAPFRPCFIAAGFAFWGYGFYLVYFRASARSDEATRAGACARPLARARALLWIGLAVLIFATTLPHLALYLGG